MSSLAQRKLNAEKQIAEDRRAIEDLDKELGMFRSRLDATTAHLEAKREERAALRAELGQSSEQITDAVRSAEALFSKARMLNRRMARNAASDHLSTTRGFTTKVTTRDYIAAPPRNIGRAGLAGATGGDLGARAARPNSKGSQNGGAPKGGSPAPQ